MEVKPWFPVDSPFIQSIDPWLVLLQPSFPQQVSSIVLVLLVYRMKPARQNYPNHPPILVEGSGAECAFCSLASPPQSVGEMDAPSAKQRVKTNQPTAPPRWCQCKTQPVRRFRLLFVRLLTGSLLASHSGISPKRRPNDGVGVGGHDL